MRRGPKVSIQRGNVRAVARMDSEGWWGYRVAVRDPETGIAVEVDRGSCPDRTKLIGVMLDAMEAWSDEP